MRRVLVATDRSETAGRAVEWASEMAERYGAELCLLQVLLPNEGATDDAEMQRVADAARSELGRLASAVAGERGRALVAIESDPSRAICDVADEEEVDVVVVGNVAMRGRKEFLLANVPNRVSHNARCTVVIVNTSDPAPKRGLGRFFGKG